MHNMHDVMKPPKPKKNQNQMSFQKWLLNKKIELLSKPIQFSSAFPQTTSTMSSSSSESELFPNPANIFRKDQEQQPDQQQPEEQQQQQEPQQEPVRVNEPSVCIPRVFKSTTRKDLYTVIERLDLGAVERIDMVPKTNDRGESYHKVFIHFKQWNKNPLAKATREKLLQGEEIKIVYNEPWFWKCTASRVEKPEFRDYGAPPPRIDLGGCKSLSAYT